MVKLAKLDMDQLRTYRSWLREDYFNTIANLKLDKPFRLLRQEELPVLGDFFVKDDSTVVVYLSDVYGQWVNTNFQYPVFRYQELGLLIDMSS